MGIRIEGRMVKSEVLERIWKYLDGMHRLVARGLLPGADADIIPQIWWNKCWGAGGLFWRELVQYGVNRVGKSMGQELLFYLDCGQVCGVGFYESTSSSKAW